MNSSGCPKSVQHSIRTSTTCDEFEVSTVHSPQVVDSEKFQKLHTLTSTPGRHRPGAKVIFDAFHAESVDLKVFSSLRVKKSLPMKGIFEGAL